MSDTSPYASGIAFCDGGFVPVDEARIPLLDWGFLRSDAVQDTVSVFHGRFFRLDDHLQRFERNWQRLRMHNPYDAGTVRAILMEAVRRTGLREAYVQMLMTRGRAPVGSRDVRLAQNRFWMFCIPYVWIARPEQKQQGLSMHVSAIQRVPKESVDPRIKHYHWLDFQMALMEGYDRGADTCAVVDRDGNIAEGPGFNIFSVKDGVVVTPPEDVCLDGMTRDTVFMLAAETNLAVRKQAAQARCDADGRRGVHLDHGRRHHSDHEGRRPGDRVRSTRSRHPQAGRSLLVEAARRLADDAGRLRRAAALRPALSDRYVSPASLNAPT